MGVRVCGCVWVSVSVWVCGECVVWCVLCVCVVCVRCVYEGWVCVCGVCVCVCVVFMFMVVFLSGMVW